LPVTHAPKALGDLRGVGHRAAAAIEPDAILETDRLHDERVAVPPADGVSVELRHVDLRQRPAVEEYLAERRVPLAEDDETARRLHDLPAPRRGVLFHEAARQAMRARIVLPVFFGALPARLGRPRLIRQTVFEAPADVDELLADFHIGAADRRARPVVLDVPHAGEV